MWKIIWFFLGSCRVRLTGGNPEWTLNRLAAERIAFQNTQKLDELTVETTILTKDIPLAEQAARKSMCDLSVEKRCGLPVLLSGLRHRIVFMVLLAAAAVSMVVLPQFVWFYRVTGNETVPTEEILHNLEDLGIGFGTYGPGIHPQWVKNHMLVRIPKLQWITITQNGAIAEVTVRERPETEPITDRKTPRNVIASRAGVITKVAVLEGNSLCRVGDVVEKGQLLVSGYTDLQTKTQVSAALAEIYAHTWHRQTDVLPQTEMVRKYSGRSRTIVSLVWGRARKILFGNGGIYAANCDKMTKTCRLTLPGGYSLPIAIEITRISDYDTIEKKWDANSARILLEKSTAERTRREMIAGTILKSDFAFQAQDKTYTLHAAMECEEMIARMVDAEIFRNEGTP